MAAPRRRCRGGKLAEELKLSKLDRIFLVNQLRILEGLYPDEAESLSVQREALERGYEMLYAWDFEYIYDGDDKMTVEESKEVWDTLDMFDAIERSTKPGVDLGEFPFNKFAGYDGNTETKFMSFARFTVERLKRFEYVPMRQPGYWNSHMPVRDVYGRMLAEWVKEPMPGRMTMSEARLKAVLAAAIHPDNR